MEWNHCTIEYSDDEQVLLVPAGDAPCSVNGELVTRATPLVQGAVILLGQTNMFRFNHPAQAEKLRKEFKGVSSLCSLISAFTVTYRALSSRFSPT